jgi:dihydrofolate synthase / folylpolyglutamate synthase
MKITPIKTPIVHPNDDLLKIIHTALPKIPEQSVLVITSKVVSLCEGLVIDIDLVDKKQLVFQEADQYIDHQQSKYGVTLTIRDKVMAVNAGIDESNVDNQYVLLPSDSYQSATEVWNFLREQYQVKDVGVVITDSTSLPLKWGTVGRALSFCGIKALKSLIGKPDIFGREMKMTQMNVAEGLAAAAVLEMGEGAEQTPLCLIEASSHVEFSDSPPSASELKDLQIEIEDDVYGPILQSADWKKGGHR